MLENLLLFLVWFLDTIFGGDKRENTYNEALKFMEDNAYGHQGNDLFKIFTPTIL